MTASPKPGNELTFSDLLYPAPHSCAAPASAKKSLRPCPFCGGNAIPLAYVSNTHRVECIQCGAETGPRETEAEAIRAWSQRGGGSSADLQQALKIIRSQQKLISDLRAQNTVENES